MSEPGYLYIVASVDPDDVELSPRLRWQLEAAAQARQTSRSQAKTAAALRASAAQARETAAALRAQATDRRARIAEEREAAADKRRTPCQRRPVGLVGHADADARDLTAYRHADVRDPIADQRAADADQQEGAAAKSNQHAWIDMTPILQAVLRT